MTMISSHFYELKLRFCFLLLSTLCTFLVFSTHQVEIVYLLGKPFLNLHQTFIFLELTEAFSTLLQISTILTFLLVFPFVIYQFWSFLIPSLYQTERNQKNFFVLFFLFLFFCEIVVTYFVLLPLICHFLLSFEISSTSQASTLIGESFSSKKNDWTSLISVEFSVRIAGYVSFLLKMCLILFLFFQIPFCVCYLYSQKVITVFHLYTNRKMCLVIALLFSAGLVPPDFLTQFFVTLVFYLLFEFLVFIGFFF